jgi:hypothetical protein
MTIYILMANFHYSLYCFVAKGYVLNAIVDKKSFRVDSCCTLYKVYNITGIFMDSFCWCQFCTARYALSRVIHCIRSEIIFM